MITTSDLRRIIDDDTEALLRVYGHAAQPISVIAAVHQLNPPLPPPVNGRRRKGLKAWRDRQLRLLYCDYVLRQLGLVDVAVEATGAASERLAITLTGRETLQLLDRPRLRIVQS